MDPVDNLVALGKDLSAGLCIGCALLRHDYREILGCAEDEAYSSEKAFPEAWIDGRRYRLRPEITAHEAVCRECNGIGLRLYTPA